AKRQYVNTTAFASIYLGLGEKEKALDWLEESYQDQESACWYLKIDPIYDSVRNEPRFQALLKKVGLDQRAPTPNNANSRPSCSPTWYAIARWRSVTTS